MKETEKKTKDGANLEGIVLYCMGGSSWSLQQQTVTQVPYLVAIQVTIWQHWRRFSIHPAFNSLHGACWIWVPKAHVCRQCYSYILPSRTTDEKEEYRAKNNNW